MTLVSNTGDSENETAQFRGFAQRISQSRRVTRCLQTVAIALPCRIDQAHGTRKADRPRHHPINQGPELVQ
jgi:hypothetical protein